MAKSKRSQKRRKKVAKRVKKQPSKHSNDSGEYMKTDSMSRVCVYSADHKFIRFATEEEANNF